MKKVALSLSLVLLALVTYMCLWPVPVEPVPWNAPADPGYAGPYAVNNKLTKLNMISLGSDEGPEQIVLAKDGMLYAAVGSGNVLRMKPDGSAQEVFVNTGGRVLGFDFDAAGNLIAADAIKGLLSVSPERQISVLTNTVDGDLIRFADAVVVAASGKIYFSDASTRFDPAHWGGPFEASVLDMIEQSASGRILEYDPASKTTRVVAKGLSFANGVALSGDQKTLFASETGKYRVWKFPVTANNLDLLQPQTEASVVLENLPGFPDNLMHGSGGKIWLGLAGPRSPNVDKMATKPFLRKMTLRLPRALWPVPKAYGHVMAFTEDGKVVEDLQDPTGAYAKTTGVTETQDRLYIQSLSAKGLGWIAK